MITLRGPCSVSGTGDDPSLPPFPRVFITNAFVCTFKTSPCAPAQRPHVQTRTKHPHHTLTTTHNSNTTTTPHHNTATTQHRQTHGDRQRERYRERTETERQRGEDKTRRKRRQDKREDETRHKRRQKRRQYQEKIKRDRVEKRGEKVFSKKCLRTPKIRQTNQPKMFRKKKKKTFRTNYSSFFLQKFRMFYRVFNYADDANSIFRARGINSEGSSGGTVKKRFLKRTKDEEK